MGPVFDHAAQRMRRGFRWRVLVWTDAPMIILSNFALLTTPKADSVTPPTPESAVAPPTVAVELIPQALQNG